jgi:hypothetical protein
VGSLEILTSAQGKVEADLICPCVLFNKNNHDSAMANDIDEQVTADLTSCARALGRNGE